MIALDLSDKIRGDASTATVIDYTLHGSVGVTITQLADGQLASTIGDLYTAAVADVAVHSITLVNTDTVARTVNLYLTPSGGTARRLIPKDLSLGAGYSLTFDGQKIQVMDTSGNILTSINLASPTFTGPVTISDLTASEIVATNASKALVSLAVATYPSLTELSYVKGVTSALQPQLGLKAPLASPSFTGTVNMAGLTASEILSTDASKNLVSLAVATYPSLAELAYVKGVTSALQTQLDLKAPLASPTFTGTVTLPTTTLGANEVFNIGGTSNFALGVYCRNIYGVQRLNIDHTYSIDAPSVDDQLFDIRARDNGVGLVAVARAQGAADPYFQLFHCRLNPVATASLPATPVEGMLYYDDTANKLKFYNGSAWETVTSAV